MTNAIPASGATIIRYPLKNEGTSRLSCKSRAGRKRAQGKPAADLTHARRREAESRHIDGVGAEQGSVCPMF
jgi:hypothetical protein